MQHVLALVGYLGVDRFGPLLLACPLGQAQIAFELAIEAPHDALAIRGHSSFLQSQVDTDAGSAAAGLGLHLHHHVQIPASPAVFAERTGPQLIARQAVAVPEAEFVARKHDLAGLVLQGPCFEGNPAQAVFAALGIGDTPAQLGFFELLARFGIVLADLLHGRRADEHTVALAESIGQLLQIEATEPGAALPDGAGAGFVAVVPDLVDLAGHRGQHLAVLVLDAQAQCLGAIHALNYHWSNKLRQEEVWADHAS